MTKRIHAAELQKLSADAVASKRQRAHLNVHESLDAGVQRFFIALEPTTYIRPHRHSQQHKSEFFVLLQGEMDLLIFDDCGTLLDRTRMSTADLRAVEIPPGTWHSYVCRTPGTITLEVKEGAYIPTAAEDFAPWAPAEETGAVAEFLHWMRTAATRSAAPGTVPAGDG